MSTRMHTKAQQQYTALFHERRLGNFRIRARTLQENLEGILQLMSHVFIVRAAFDSCDGSFAYTAYSDYFDTVPEGEIAPDYVGIFRAEGDAAGEFLGFNRVSRGCGKGCAGCDSAATTPAELAPSPPTEAGEGSV